MKKVFCLSFLGFFYLVIGAWATSDLPDVVVAQGSALRVRSQPHLKGRVNGYFNLGEEAFVLQRTSTTETIDGRSDPWLLLLSTSGRFGWAFGGYWGTVNREWKEPLLPRGLMEWDFPSRQSQLSDVGKEWATAYFYKSILESPGRWNAMAFSGLAALERSADYSRDLFLEILKSGIDIPYGSEEDEYPCERFEANPLVVVLKAFWPEDTDWVALLCTPPEDPTPKWKWHVLPVLLQLMEMRKANPDSTFLKEAALEAPAPIVWDLNGRTFSDDIKNEIAVLLLQRGTVDQRRAAITYFHSVRKGTVYNVPLGTFILDALHQAQSDPDAEVRRSALSIFSIQFASSWKDAKQPIWLALRDPSPEVRIECLAIIARWKTPLEVLPMVVDLLSDQHLEVAVAAISALGAGDEDSRYWDPLTTVLWPPKELPQKRKRAAEVLSVDRFRRHAASAFQKTVLEDDPILSAQSAAVLCQPDFLENQLPTLLKVLSKGTPEARAVVRQGLRSSSDPQARQSLVLENQRYALEQWEEKKSRWKLVSGVSPAVTFNNENRLQFVVSSRGKTAVTIRAPSTWGLREDGVLEWVRSDSRDVSQYLFRKKSEASGQIVLECRVADLRVEGAFVFQRPGLYEINLTDTSGEEGVSLFFEPEPSLQFSANIKNP